MKRVIIRAIYDVEQTVEVNDDFMPLSGHGQEALEQVRSLLGDDPAGAHLIEWRYAQAVEVPRRADPPLGDFLR